MQVSGDRIELTGDLLIDTAAAVVLDSTKALDTVLATSNTAVFDLSKVATVDSAALAVVFEWVRAARGIGSDKQAKITNVPAALLSLAEVYGVGELLPVL